MTLVQSWIDSLTLFKPKNAQLFIMVTIKSIIEVYKLLSYCFLLLLLMLGICIWSLATGPSTLSLQRELAGEILSGSFYWILLFVTCVATRPSVMKKDWAYFKLQNKKIIYWLLLPILMAILAFALVQIFSMFFSYNALFGYWWMMPALIYRLFLPKLLAGYIFFILFFADSAGGPKDFLRSLWNALKMIIFNYPLLVIVGICFYLPVLIFYKAWIFYNFIYIPSMIRNIIAAMLLPISVCTYANIYIKKLHDQFDLYFPRS